MGMHTMGRHKKILLAAAALLVLLASAVWFFIYGQRVSTDDASIDGHTVVMSPKISGYVKKIYVKDNQVVKAGDVIMEIDPKDYELQVENARAALAAAQAAMAAGESRAGQTAVTAPAGAASAREKERAAQAVWEKSSADLGRMEELIRGGACSQQEYDQAVAAERSARASLDQTKDDVTSANAAPYEVANAQSTADQLTAQVKQAEAALAQAEMNLSYTKITAPMDGRITKRSVDTGSYVAAGTQLCSLVGFDLWVTANYKESELKGMKPGDPADISVDAYPGLKLRGRVDSFQAGTGSYFSLFPAENATGNFVKTVQRVPVKITFERLSQEDAELLGPGLSVVPTVYIRGSR